MMFRLRENRSQLLASVLVCLCLCAAEGGEVTDRMLALVNDRLITESDVIWAIALDPEVQPLNLSAANRQLMLERLIDQQLLLQEAEKTPQNEPSEEEVKKYREELVRRFGSQEAFLERMKKVALDVSALNEITRRRLVIEKYVAFRFRSFVFVRPEEVERYYNEVEKPRWQRAGETIRPLDDALRAEIESTLENQRINSELDRFFDETRAQAQVVRLSPLQ
jgi:hypothetical protein